MIRYGNAKFSYANIGHFLTDKEWIHPSINQKTHQIIFVASGDVYIVEKDQEYNQYSKQIAKIVKMNILLF